MRILIGILLGAFVLSACDSAEELIVGSLVVEDLIEGSGAAAVSGDSLRVYFVLSRQADDRVCSSVLDTDPPFAFRLGGSGFIQGWNDGLVGMKETGRRRITVPPNLGYGLEGAAGNCIRPNEFLIFTIDLVELIEQ